MNTENGIVEQGRDPKRPTPALHLKRDRTECKDPEDAAAYPAQQHVIGVWIIGIERPEEHGNGDCLWNPDSFHLAPQAPVRVGVE